VALALDDFYLPQAGLQAVAAAHPDNALLQHRGNAGTHDVPLLVATLDRLRALPTSAAVAAAATRGTIAAPVPVPVFDKALHGGRGDRLPEALWRTVAGPVDVVLLEGWMVGFRALPDAAEGSSSSRSSSTGSSGGAALASIHPGLPAVNRLLRAYDAVTARLDALVQLAVADLAVVTAWRLDAEHALAAATGRPCMSDEQTRAFVAAFLPAYKAYLPALATYPPCPPDRYLRIALAPDRSVAV
jgi:D-glycerate 3-kinase